MRKAHNAKRMKNKQIEAIVFDFDGTLAQLTIDFNEMKRRLKDLEFAFLDGQTPIDGLPALEWIELVSNQVKKTDQALGKEFNTRCRFLVTSMEIEAATRGRMFPNSLSMLNTLKNKGIKTAVITRNSASAIRTVCPDITKFNECVLAREDVTLVKPHPEHLIQAINIMKVKKERTLMVGDHPMDIETGHNAGTMSAGVASGTNSLDELEKANPDFLADNCNELMFILKEKELI